MARVPAGICLTFDDLFVENWCAARSVFDGVQARVTFCVSHIHRATDSQIKGLHMLQDDGHEIGFHSRTHPKLKPYLARHGLAHWVEHEIDAGIAEHRALGFPASSFASPFHASTAATRQATASRFKIVRARGPRGVTEARLAGRIYQGPGPDRAVDNIGFADAQHRAFPGWDWHNQLLDAIADQGGVGVFTGHDIRAAQNGAGFYSTRAQITELCRAARDRGLHFYRLSEFADMVA